MTVMLLTNKSSQGGERSPVSMIALIGECSLATDLTCALAHSKTIAVKHWETLAQFALAQQQETSNVALVVSLSAFCQPAFDHRVQSWCKQRHLALLRIGIWQHEAVIGPFVSADQPGCVACAEMRRIRALMTEARNELHFLTWCEDESHLQNRAANPWLTQSTRQVISLIAAQEIETFIHTGTPMMGFQAVRFLRLRALTNSCHTFLPDPLCEICAQPQDDSAQDAILHFQPHVRTDIHQYRVRSVASELSSLEARYVDNRMGLHIIPPNGLHANAAAFATTVTHYFEYPHIKQSVTGSGLAYSFHASRTTAILEALERSAGFLPKAKRSVVYGSYAQLQEQAINPETFGLFSEQPFLQKLSGSQRFTAYSSTLPFHWVWAYSLRRQQPVLVPEQIAYYGMQALRPETENFLLETSNGCAVGGSIEDATLHGLCEVIERDAFFLTWYARLQVPALDWRSTHDADLLLAIERSMRMTGFEFYAFDCTTDFALPVILMLAVNKEDRAPRVILGAAAHLDPDKALATAFFETASTIVGQSERFPRDSAKGKRLIEDSALILSIEDHVLAGAMPEAFSRFAFLLAERPLQTLQERFAAHYARQPSLDLTEELLSLIKKVIHRGYDVIIVDQTSPELRAGNFSCVRVLVPGLIPLTFGHAFRRTRHLHRLSCLPKELGYTDHDLTDAEMNTDPHAFP
jgi:ribosomal protein S12 methylthiotransferase accessory factor